MNNQTTLPAFRYALAFFKETYLVGGENLVLNDMKFIDKMMQAEKKLVDCLLNRYLDSQKKMAIFDSFSSQLQKKTNLFLAFLHLKKRLELFPQIIKNYLLFHEEKQGIKKLTLYLRDASDSKIETSILQVLEKKMGTKFKLVVKEDPKMIGGFKYRIDDLFYDYSLAGKIKNLSGLFQTQ